MNRKERFHATIERRPVDRPAFWMGLPVSASLQALFRHFGVDSPNALKAAVGDDVWPIEVPFNKPPANHIACAFDFVQGDQSYEERTMTSRGWFHDITDPAQVDTFPWPDPRNHMDPVTCRSAIDAVPSDYATLGMLWSAHFQDACAAFGMEQAMTVLLEVPEMFKQVIDSIMRFYLEANEIFYRATVHRLDAVLIGNDFGSQCGLIVQPDLIREYVFPGTKVLIDQAHSYGVKVIHHSCGAVRDLIPDLVSMGADAVHPIQALATGMDAAGLQRDFGNTISFCGGVDAQHLLATASADEVFSEVTRLKGLFPTGLIISPSHEAILPDIAPENIAAIAKAAVGR